eukprot:COSAG01_NODE_56209_length_320_cov_0.343891_1_plen_48_part_00
MVGGRRVVWGNGGHLGVVFGGRRFVKKSGRNAATMGDNVTLIVDIYT